MTTTLFRMLAVTALLAAVGGLGGCSDARDVAGAKRDANRTDQQAESLRERVAGQRDR